MRTESKKLLFDIARACRTIQEFARRRVSLRCFEMTDIAMIPRSIEEHREALAALCLKFGVRRLELFGSAAAGRFKEGQSDFDFLVIFKNDRVNGIARLYLGLAEGLEQLLGRPVDLLTPESIRNPYFRQTVDATRRLIYED